MELTEKIKSIVADSFGQMNLVLNIEKEFDITLEFDEIFKILSTQTLLEVVEDKLNENRK